MPGFDQQTIATIQQWEKKNPQTIEIDCSLGNQPEDEEFNNFIQQITHVTSNLKINTVINKTDVLPGFLLRKNIRYSALALKKELEPFLEALLQINENEMTLPKALQELLDKIDIPVHLKLFIALQCPHCPGVVRLVIPLAFHCPHIHLHIIDGSLFPEIAQQNQVMAAPCLILDDEFRWTGAVLAEEIVQMIINRDPSQLSLTSLKNILEQGDATWITDQMVKADKIFDAFIELILHDTWSVRLGAIVVVEELVEKNPLLALQICPKLFELFDKQEVTVKGDILYVIGEAGNLETKNQIEKLVADINDENIIDAAKDAIESIESRL
ncbi:MAG: hypothetical protein GY729_06230 [Desulfobacteraceae bacterium]|nr:hypothetical protein [Desulfobacteraceae bacterium]